MEFRWIAVLIIYFFVHRARSAQTIQQFLDTMLTGYDKRIRPNESDVTKVSLDMFVNEISSVNENSMDYTISVYFRQRWNDPRLKFTAYTEPITLGYLRVGELWVPDTFFNNEKKASSHGITVPNKLLRVYPNGDVLYSQRVSLVLSCPMDLAYFPLDTQKCQLRAETYGYTSKEMVYTWYKNSDEAIQLDENVTLPEFAIIRERTRRGNCTVVYITGTYSCLFVEFTMKRQIQYYVSQTFVPSIMIVCLSFVSFFIDVRAVPARVSLGLITILTITTMNAGVTQTLPKVSYTKAIDVWMAVCLVFVVSALLEYALANHRSRQEDVAKAKLKEKEQKEQVVAAFAQKFKAKIRPDEEREKTNGNAEVKTETREPKPKKKRFTSEQIENISKILFPTAFLVFNILYWMYYGISAAYV